MTYDIKDYDGFKAAIDEICAYLSSCSVSQDKVFDCRLIVFELIGNVLQHSGGGAQLQLDIEKERIRISIKAEKNYRPPVKGECPQASAERGRGLYLVDSFSLERTFTEKGEIIVYVAIS